MTFDPQALRWTQTADVQAADKPANTGHVANMDKSLFDPR